VLLSNSSRNLDLKNFFAEPTVLLVRITSRDVQICFYPEKSYFFLNNEKNVRSLNKLETKYALALDNYGQSCFVSSDLKKIFNIL
jgi:hypothetical protein